MSDGVRFLAADLSMHQNDYMVMDFPYQFYYPGRESLTLDQQKEIKCWLISNFGRDKVIYLEKRWEFRMDRVYLKDEQDAFTFKLRWV